MGGTCVPVWSEQYLLVPGENGPVKEKVKEDYEVVTRITSLNENAFSPTISPSGKIIAFSTCSDLRGFGNRFNVKMTDSKGGAGIEIVTKGNIEGYYPSWYPDGNKILFTSLNYGYPNIRAMSSSGIGGIDNISTMGFRCFDGDVSPDGQCIAFSTANIYMNRQMTM